MPQLHGLGVAARGAGLVRRAVESFLRRQGAAADDDVVLSGQRRRRPGFLFGHPGLAVRTGHVRWHELSWDTVPTFGDGGGGRRIAAPELLGLRPMHFNFFYLFFVMVTASSNEMRQSRLGEPEHGRGLSKG